MIIIPLIILLILGAVYSNKFIRKNNVLLYIIFLVLSIASFVFIKVPIFTPFRLGFLGLSFFYVVMITGALKDRSKLRIALMKVRMEYSIIGFIVITPHAIFYFIQFLNGKISAPIFGIIAYVIMIPLFITSFKIIRNKFTYKNWKFLQRFAYLSYGALLIHLILNAKPQNIPVYIIAFAIYIGLKAVYVYNSFKKHKLEEKQRLTKSNNKIIN